MLRASSEQEIECICLAFGTWWELSSPISTVVQPFPHHTWTTSNASSPVCLHVTHLDSSCTSSLASQWLSLFSYQRVLLKTYNSRPQSLLQQMKCVPLAHVHTPAPTLISPIFSVAPNPPLAESWVFLAVPATVVKNHILHYHHPVGISQRFVPEESPWGEEESGMRHYAALTVCSPPSLPFSHSHEVSNAVPL